MSGKVFPASTKVQKCLPIYLTADVGPTDAVMGSGHTCSPSWDATFQGLELLNKYLPLLEQQTQHALPVSWFVRADRFIKHQLGNRLAILHQFIDKMDKLITNNHELGWMPQLPSGKFETMQYEDLLTTHSEVMTIFADLESVRMGDCYHDNTSMQLLNKLGIRIDSSAIPGRVKHDRGWQMDWQVTPQHAYHPCRDDYRRAGIPALDILEVPLSVAPILAPYDSTPILRYINPCYKTNFWHDGLTSVIEKAPYIVCIFHPDELITRNQSGGHPLISYSYDVFNNNIINLINLTATLGRTISFRTLRNFNSFNN